MLAIQKDLVWHAEAIIIVIVSEYNYIPQLVTSHWWRLSCIIGFMLRPLMYGTALLVISLSVGIPASPSNTQNESKWKNSLAIHRFSIPDFLQSVLCIDAFLCLMIGGPECSMQICNLLFRMLYRFPAASDLKR